MFTTVPLTIDTTNFKDSCYGKGTSSKVETVTAFRSREAALYNEYLRKRREGEKPTPLYNTIGVTNLTIVDDHLVIKEKTLLEIWGSLEYIGQDAYARFYLQHTLNGKMRGFKKYGPDLYLRPILITTSDNVKHARDILGIAGFQLLSRNNVQHNQLKPIMVRGIKYAKEVL